MAGAVPVRIDTLFLVQLELAVPGQPCGELVHHRRAQECFVDEQRPGPADVVHHRVLILRVFRVFLDGLAVVVELHRDRVGPADLQMVVDMALVELAPGRRAVGLGRLDLDPHHQKREVLGGIQGHLRDGEWPQQVFQRRQVERGGLESRRERVLHRLLEIAGDGQPEHRSQFREVEAELQTVLRFDELQVEDELQVRVLIVPERLRVGRLELGERRQVKRERLHDLNRRARHVLGAVDQDVGHSDALQPGRGWDVDVVDDHGDRLTPKRDAEHVEDADLLLLEPAANEWQHLVRLELKFDVHRLSVPRLPLRQVPSPPPLSRAASSPSVPRPT